MMTTTEHRASTLKEFYLSGFTAGLYIIYNYNLLSACHVYWFKELSYTEQRQVALDFLFSSWLK